MKQQKFQLNINLMGGACGMYGRRGVHKVFVGKPEEKRIILRWISIKLWGLDEVGSG
jgi:hypothetical protein